MQYPRLRSILFGFLVFSASAEAWATVLLHMDIEAMQAVSERIVKARVLSSEPMQSPGRAIETKTVFQPMMWIQGRPGNEQETFVLSLPGGKVGNLETRVPGVPVFQTGEEVVLFLEKVEGGWTPCGLTQGVYRFLESPHGPMVQRSLSGATFIRKTAAGRFIQMGHSVGEEPPVPLQQLIDKIHSCDPAGVRKEEPR